MSSMDYSLVQRTPDGNGKILVTTPGVPNVGSFETEQQLKDFVNNGMQPDYATDPSKWDVIPQVGSFNPVPSDSIAAIVDNLQNQIDAIGGGITPKGSVPSTSDLPSADPSNKGWMYFVEDIGKYKVSDGTQWIDFGDYPLLSYATRADFPSPGAQNTLYIDLGGKRLYWWDGAQYVSDLENLDAEAARLDSRIDSNSMRIENLEYKSSPFTVDYPDTTYGEGTVPSSIAKSGKALRTKGENGTTNQLANPRAISSSGLTITVSDGEIDVDGTTTEDFSSQICNPGTVLAVNRVGLVGFLEPNVKWWDANHEGSGSALDGLRIKNITSGLDGVAPYYYIPSGTAFSHKKLHFICRDLTTIFPDLTSAQIVALGVGGVLKQRPDLALYDDYNVGTLIKPMVTGLECVGVNIWDEETERASIDWSTNKFTPSPSGGRLASKNYISVTTGVTYYGTNFYSQQPAVFGYEDMTSNGISLTINSDNTITIPLGVNYVKFGLLVSSYGDTYNHDIQLAENSLPSSIKTTYHPHFHSEISFSEPVELNGVGTSEDVIDVESGAITRQMGSYTFTGEETWTSYSGTSKRTDITGLGAKNIGANDIPNLTNDMGLVTTSRNAIQSAGGITVSATTIIISNDSVALAVAGRHICFELATPTTDTIAPSPIALAVEPYGQIRVKQSTTPLSLGFTMEYMPSSPYITKSDVVDNLTSTETQLPLSANMGRCLNTLLDIERKRIDNLEQTSGQTEIEVSYPDDVFYSPNLVPPKSAKWAGIKTLRGKMRAWNNTLSIGNFESSTGWTTDNATINSVADNVLSFTATANKGRLETAGDYRPYFSQGHAYIFVIQIKLTTATTSVYLNDGFSNTNAIATTSWQTLVSVVSNWTSYSGLWRYPAVVDGRTGSWDAIQVRKALVRDLTLIFPDNTPTTVADALQGCADLAKWDDYNAGSLVTETVSGVKSIGVNIWGEEWEVGAIDFSTGEDSPNLNRIRSVGQTRVMPSTTYYLYCGTSARFELFFYDINGNYIAGDDINRNATFTTPSTAYGMRFCPYTAYGASYKDDITIAIGSSAVSYHAHEEHTLTLPTPFTGKSAGSVAEVYDLETGEVTEPLGEKTSGYNWTLSEYGYWRSDVISDIKYNDGNTPANVLCDKYVTYSSATLVNTSGLIGIAQASTGRILARTGDLVNAPNISILYELATPDPDTTVTPMDEPTIQVQGGGTINTIQTQTPVLDNCLDVTYDIIP